MTKFEQYLRKIHAKNYTGTDDDMSDDFEHWITQLENEDLMKYADEMLDQFAKDVKSRVIGKKIGKDFGYGYITVNGKKRLADEKDAKLLNDHVEEQRTALASLLEEWRI